MQPIEISLDGSTIIFFIKYIIIHVIATDFGTKIAISDEGLPFDSDPAGC